MKNILDKIEKDYQIPCGPFSISADAVCRKSLKDTMDRLLDRLTKEVSPEESLKDQQVDPEELKKKMIESGKLRAEVQLELKKYREELQGNSKMLQDISGEIEPF